MAIDKNELETRLEQIQIEKTGFEETYQSVMILMDSLRSVLKKTYLTYLNNNKTIEQEKDLNLNEIISSLKIFEDIIDEYLKLKSKKKKNK